MPKRTSCKKYKEFEKEELRTAKDYNRRGFYTQGKQEAEHSIFFANKYKKKPITKNQNYA